MTAVLARRLFLAICVGAACVTYFVWRPILSAIPNDEIVNTVSPRHHILIDLPGCRIPNIDPFDPSIQKLITKGEPLDCSDIPGLTYQINNTVYVNETVASGKHYRRKFSHCQTDTLTRVETNSDNKFQYEPNPDNFTKSCELRTEFTRIRCYNTNGSVIHYNFYAINTYKPHAEERYRKHFPDHIRNHSVKHAYNVLLMGIDSVSRLNFIRHFEKTRAFLLETLGALDITGYNKVADNTFVNIVPFLSGKYVPELPYNDRLNTIKPFDDYDFIFKRFRSAGYRTLYAEDDPFISIFNYIRQGFYKLPADDYPRPMSVAMENEKSIWFKEHCVHERGEHDIYTDYIYRFIKANTDAKRPYFSFSFLTRITHYWMNKAALADDHHFKFLRRLHKQQLLNNTIMFYFSDHGMRFGAIRDTYVGKMSARLPLMYVYLPPSFRREYSELYKNVVTNAHRLTTPFDIYETLRDILYFNESVGRPTNISSRGISLFSEIPAERTCHHARIEPHWCACSQETPVSVNDTIVKQTAQFAVQQLNAALNDSRNICHILRLDSVTAAFKLTPNIKALAYKSETKNIEQFQKEISTCIFYQVTIVTSPGYGRFETTVKHLLSDNTMEMAGDPSRTNVYGATSWCVDSPRLRKFCYCRQQKS